jgi:hypothetical protein
MMNEDPKTKALSELLQMIIQSGLLESLEMPKPEGAMEELTEEMPEELEEEGYEDELEDDMEEEEPVLSITQLGASAKPMKKDMGMELKKAMGGKRRGR